MNYIHKFENYLVPKFVPHLNVIASKKGQLKPTEDARTTFNNWRKKWRGSQGPDKTGFLNRVPDHVLKVAMCLCLSDWEFDGQIRQPDIEHAIEKVVSLIYANKRTTEGRGNDPLAANTKIVLDILLAESEQMATRKRILQRGWGNFNSFTFDQIAENLMEMGASPTLAIFAQIESLYV